MKNKIEKIVTVVLSTALLWIFTSFIEVNCKNLSETPVYSPANFFVIMNKISG